MKNITFAILLIIVLILAGYFIFKPKTSFAPISEIELTTSATATN